MNKTVFYDELTQDMASLLEGERSFLTVMANSCALLFERLEGVNWAGFYLLSEPDVLVLGPFQGKIACARIPVSKGVCGAAVMTGCVQRIGDVDSFPGHIACDAISRSEIVLPLRIEDEIIGVLDIDSPLLNRFDQQDETGLKALSDQLCRCLTRANLQKFIHMKCC